MRDLVKNSSESALAAAATALPVATPVRLQRRRKKRRRANAREDEEWLQPAPPESVLKNLRVAWIVAVMVLVTLGLAVRILTIT